MNTLSSTGWSRAGRNGARTLGGVLAILILLLATAPQVVAAGCTKDDFAKAIDGAAEGLRSINDEFTIEVRTRIEALRKKRSWTEEQFLAVAPRIMQEPEIQAADERINELLGQIDAMGDETGSGPPDCSKLAQLETRTAELHETMRGKWERILANIDREMAAGTATADAGKPKPKPKLPAPKAEPMPAPGDATGGGWTSESEPAAGPEPVPEDAPEVLVGGLPSSLESYSIAEIQSAGRGFFGTISTELASVLGYAFESAGRPTGYILGSEGGGAVIAGVRYGSGRLHTKSGRVQRVYWHGPSIGYDLGAAGGRTMILVYNLKELDQMYGNFAGLDGSAYLVGGVGITFLTDGNIVMAPIRSGLGLRLGANIGYLSFTREETWVPF